MEKSKKIDLQDIFLGKVYCRYRNGMYNMFCEPEELMWLYFNVYTDKKNESFVKIGITKNKIRRKRENDAQYSGESTNLYTNRIPYAKKIESYIHNVYLGEEFRAKKFYDIDLNTNKKKYIKFNNKETYHYNDVVQEKVVRIIQELRKINYIDKLNTLTYEIFMKYIFPSKIENEFEEVGFYNHNEIKFDYDEYIKANLTKKGMYRITPQSEHKVLNLRTKKLDDEWEKNFIKNIYSIISKNRPVSKRQLNKINELCIRYSNIN